MGFPCEINYILRLKKDQGLDEHALKVGETFEFSKEGHRIYPIDAPIDLANDAWEIIGRIAVRDTCIGNGRTTGHCQVLLIYPDEESKILTKINQDGENANKRFRSPHS